MLNEHEYEGFFAPYPSFFPVEEKASMECGLEIPSSLSDCQLLRMLALSINQLTRGIPQAIGSLSNLEELYLDNKKLTGEIPSEIGNLVQLQILSLWNNSLTGALFLFLFFHFSLKLSRI